jgi:hypothetical protein
MAEGWGATAGNSAVTTVTSAYPWVKLHTGAPGSAGTSNAATETTRKEVTAWNSASGGSRTSNVALTWTSIAGSQDATHFTTWDASTAGNFGYSGTVTANPYTAGDTLTIASGSLSVSVTLAS